MRTNIIIDNDLMMEALRASGLKTKKAAVDAGLRLLIETKKQANIRKLRGKIMWEGNLDALRKNRTEDV